MTIFYIDFENGNDANAGTSFATRWKTITNGATAARIAPGDEIRVMASPDPTSIGNATWTGGGRPATVSISSSTNATPIVITTSAAHGLVPGDYVVVVNHNTNTNANGVWKVGTTPTSTTFQILQLDGSNTTGNGTGSGSGTVTKANNLVVKTATPLVQNIALCGGLGQKPVWTASSNVTATNPTAGREGNGTAQIAIGSAFTTGKAAYYTLPATLNLSGYQQVSFWVRLASGIIGAAGQTYVALCSDTTGNTVVHQCPVPALGSTAAWVPVTVNLGTNLSTTINSVAFYVVTDLGAQTFILDNIIACKAASSADSITIQSLISKSNGAGDEAWYAVQSINYDVIMLANTNASQPTALAVRGYTGTTETVTTYKRETIKTTPASSDAIVASTINDSGVSGNAITFSGGWNRTDMSTQTGHTWFDGLNGRGIGVSSDTRSYVTIDRLNCCRYYNGYSVANASTGFNVPSVYATACSFGFYFNTGRLASVTNMWVNNNDYGAYLYAGFGNVVTNLKTASNNSSNGVYFQLSGSCYVGDALVLNGGSTTFGANVNFVDSYGCQIGYLTSGYSSSGYGIIADGSIDCSINGGITEANGLAAIRTTSTSVNKLYLNNFTINQSSEISFGSTGLSVIYSNRHDDTDNNSWVWSSFGTVNQQTAVVDSPATTAWRMAVASADASASAPLKLKLGTVVCAAGSLVTVTARMRRNTTLMTMRLVCPGGQISGVSSDVTSDLTAAIDTWDTVTITFTPTKPGGVDIYAYAFGTSTSIGYVCNLTASQA